jgi:hypothetical protein
MPAPDDLSPAEEAAVRARLAEARHTGPVPADVAARLDAVLADLAAGRGEEDAPPPAPVVPLPTRASRRRRAVVSGLVAAAAVVTLGVALPQLVRSGGTGGSDSASTADSAGAGSEAGRGADGGSAATSPGGSSDAGAADGKLSESFAAPVALRSGEPLRPVVRPLVRQGIVSTYDPDPGCVLDTGAGDRVDATWDGLPAVVVLRPAEAGRRVVEVYTCGTGEVVASTSLRVP